MSAAAPMKLYALMRGRFGFLNWWPADTKFEILAGAVLTQQTSWKNVERALANLRRAHALSLESIAHINITKLERLIRPSGFYRQKAARLKGICSYILGNYGTLERFLSQNATALRKELLSLNGVGEETADSIVLYAGGKPVFVIDAYTRRAMHRVAGTSENISYGELQGFFESRARRNVRLYKDMHAQFVELGKRYCKAKPVCEGCPLNSVCMYFRPKKQVENY